MLIYAFISALILPFIDAWRIHRSWGSTANIKHSVSVGLAVIAAVAVYWARGYKLDLVNAAIWVLYCVAIRGLVFDIMLNVFRRERPDYVSATTSSAVDHLLGPVPFWLRRIGYAALVTLSIILKIKLWHHLIQ